MEGIFTGSMTPPHIQVLDVCDHGARGNRADLVLAHDARLVAATAIDAAFKAGGKYGLEETLWIVEEVRGGGARWGCRLCHQGFARQYNEHLYIWIMTDMDFPILLLSSSWGLDPVRIWVWTWISSPSPMIPSHTYLTYALIPSQTYVPIPSLAHSVLLERA